MQVGDLIKWHFAYMHEDHFGIVLKKQLNRREKVELLIHWTDGTSGWSENKDLEMVSEAG